MKLVEQGVPVDAPEAGMPHANGRRLRRMAMWLALSLLLIFLGGIVRAADTPAEDDGVPLTVANRKVFIFHAPLFGLTPQQRAKRAKERIDALPESRLRSPVVIEPFMREGTPGVAVMIEGAPIFSLVERDLEPGDPPLEQVAAAAGQRLHDALQVRWDRGGKHLLVMSIVWVAAATAVAVLLLVGLQHFAVVVFDRTLRLRQRVAQRSFMDVRRIGVSVLVHLIDWVKYALMFVVVYVWLAYSLSQFPYTEPWGESLGRWLLSIAERVVLGVIHAVPDLVMVAFIAVVTHLLVRGLHALLDAAQASGVRSAALQPDTIGATRRLSSVFVWLFGLVVAYPFLPGSGSDAFKGVSVLFGLLVTLGSSGLVSQVMGGFVLIYTRALHPGDLVQIGDTDGRVVELGALSTKIRTRLDHEVTIPNSVVISSRIVNLSETTDRAGSSLATSVTIGYDTPWRQVHAMLELAAGRTTDVLKKPAPSVRQTALQDFYVAYELNVFMRQEASKAETLTELHSHILDVFNEHGVQIMSPNFRAQPDQLVLVDKQNWYAAPARQADAT
ncbi:mechanosensitive ion channel [Variovorax sp. J22R133]|uniref:mechanosensitive ion channel family protein n=1 Tax=Variovorax brevis TaxID=3053503 RepID=UPI0025785937|nr:mechanosensitive ion channel domain-containing protein [Variovorax sp. J22R133]MDM0110608.1 mechanosensitive ion channel [Variovorax sp. J22R133]